jgi:hypothetical protein
MKKIFLQFDAGAQGGSQGGGARNQNADNNSASNSDRSGATAQSQGSQGDPSKIDSPPSGPAAAGPSATGTGGESEDQNADGIKDKESHNSAKEGLDTENLQPPQEGVKSNTSSELPTPPPPPPNDREGEPAKSSERIAAEERMEEAADNRKINAQAAQTGVVAGAAITARSLSATLKKWARDEEAFEEDKHVAVAQKKLLEAGDTFAGAVRKEPNDSDAVVLAVAAGLTKKQRVLIVISQINASVSNLKNNKKEAGRTLISADITDGIELLENAVASLEKSVA